MWRSLTWRNVWTLVWTTSDCKAQISNYTKPKVAYYKQTLQHWSTWNTLTPPPSLPQWMGLGIGQYMLHMSNILFPSVPQLPQKRVKCWAEDFVYLSGADGNFLSDEESDEDKTGFKIASPKEGCPKKMSACEKALDNNRNGGDPKFARVCTNYGHLTKRAPTWCSGHIEKSGNSHHLSRNSILSCVNPVQHSVFLGGG